MYKSQFKAFLQGFLQAGGKKGAIYEKVVERGKKAPEKADTLKKIEEFFNHREEQ